VSDLEIQPIGSVDAYVSSRVAELEKQNTELQKQIQELQAHVERLRDGVKWIEQIVELHQFGRDGDYGLASKISDAAYEVLDETPAQSLETLKAQWKAQAVLQFAGHVFVKYRYDIIEWAKEYADKLRTQGAV